MHPLVSDLSKLTDDELHKKHGELMQRLNFAYGRGRNSHMVQQIYMLLDDYRNEIQRRNQKHLEEMQRQIEARQKNKK